MIWVGRMWVGAKQQANQWIARLLGKKVKQSKNAVSDRCKVLHFNFAKNVLQNNL